VHQSSNGPITWQLQPVTSLFIPLLLLRAETKSYKREMNTMEQLTKSVVVKAAIYHQVYNYWRNFENFPRVCGCAKTHLATICRTGESATAGRRLRDAKTTSVQENKKKIGMAEH